MNPWRIALAILLIAAAGFFLVGVSVERSEEDDHGAETSESTNSEEDEEQDEAGEASESSEEGTEAAEEGEEEGEEEKLFGVDTESNATIAAFVIVSLAVAAAALLVRSWVALLAVVAFAVAAFGLDVREVLQKADESETTVATLAAIVAILHLLAACIALWLISRANRTQNA